MIKVGEKFTESSEHSDTSYIVTRVEGDKVYAKEFIAGKSYEPEHTFSEKELLHGNAFCSYWFWKE